MFTLLYLMCFAWQDSKCFLSPSDFSPTGTEPDSLITSNMVPMFPAFKGKPCLYSAYNITQTAGRQNLTTGISFLFALFVIYCVMSWTLAICMFVLERTAWCLSSDCQYEYFQKICCLLVHLESKWKVNGMLEWISKSRFYA